MTNESSSSASNFIREAIEEDLRQGRFTYVRTRFPPEPNGYLHIGHAKAICIDFGLAEAFGGKCNLRFDDTNPVKEDVEYVEAIKEDIHWLGFDWEDREFYASDYFEQLYQFAIKLIKKGKAYVDDLSPEQIREYRGTLTEPGKESPYRNRSVEENLNLFERMRAGEFPDGARVLRAKIDMASGNMNLRDPVMYRIIHATHHRTGDQWCIYPMYDFAHGQSDSIEGVTHSLCDLAYEDHRPLYDWFLDELEIFHPRQIEFARLNLSYTILSKRYLKQLVEQGYVRGWDDPRMPTLRGMRRRGYTPEAIRRFIEQIGVSKNESLVDISLLEHILRDDLNQRVPRVMGVLDPVKVVITNYPEGQVEEFEAVNNPEDESAGTRLVPFSKVLYIERDDFREVPPPKYHRLSPGREVRLRYGYIIRCEEVVKDPQTGEVVEIRCTYDPETRGGYAPDGRKVKGTIHWVSALHAVDAEVRLYDRLFTVPEPGKPEEGKTYLDYLNPDSLKVLTGCKVEPSLLNAVPGDRFQFERKGYFCVDPDSTPGHPVFNLTATLRDTWAKIEGELQGG
ncbi:MAG TPA: glutamine--tRNA ligase/YqeY domain fusion protein [Anaerolinea thermolimosa]|uniref:Glutamine--tRNA ligase n=1 Tax=Anaerolinea thermolimosa TaxID=229919 RepID=A0A3D1JEL7_9CHLR|nr:glutamine--tRNA ligase/YqeY domain fusion protein [Anaerolinea thermolimosa]GAP07323.1 glutaminyl-tRNA synthetase [Anaerolinea thermolimosa]HCE16884.1 glutamine--tRNA ligase/YqeY domain fusion protein [Anaerolinea thermolimosa]